MFRYLALLWNDGIEDQRSTALELKRRVMLLRGDWKTALDTAGLFVGCAGEREESLLAQELPDRSGVILGTLWAKCRDPLDDSPMPRARLSSEQVRALIRSDGQLLTRDYWGNYVAIISGESHVTLLLSPTASLPCLVIKIGTVTMVFSCITDAITLGYKFRRPSHRYLRNHVLDRPIDIEDPVHGLTRLLRGEALSFPRTHNSSLAERKTYWRPTEFAETAQPIEDPEYAVRALRSSVHACTHTLIADHPSALLRLSGGLDSTIVCASLRSAPSRPRITCYTYYLPGNTSDTRPWARRAAAYSGYETVEVALDSSAFCLQSVSSLQPSSDVVSRTRYLDRPQRERSMCQEYDATGVLTGDGGDSGFCSDSVGFALSEYWKRHPYGTRTVGLASQVALATHRTIWHVMGRSWRYLQDRGVSISDWQHSRAAICHLVHRDAAQTLDDEPRFRHPWFSDDTALPLATLYRLGALVMPPEFYDLSVPPEIFAPETIHPLFAQPVVELMLRIPLYVHFDGGRDRGLARRAFTQYAPSQNLQRLWKDRAPGFTTEVVDRNAEWLRQILLDGVLVRERLLDRSKVEAALSDSVSRSSVNPVEIIRHLQTELWARQWE